MTLLPRTRAALISSLEFVERDLNKPCNHNTSDAREVRRLIQLALAELQDSP